MRLIFPLFLSVIPAFGQSDPLFGFEPNTGQFPPAVTFVRRTSSNLLYFTRDSAVLRNNIRIQIAGVDPKIVAEGDSPSATVYNFYQGNIPAAWRNIPRSPLAFGFS